MLGRLVKTSLFTAVMPATVGAYLLRALKSGGPDLGVPWRYGGAARMTAAAFLHYTRSNAI
jgi:hypothetical protein